MAKPRTAAEKKLKQTEQLRLIMIICGLFTLLNVVLRVSTGPFDLLFMAVEVLLGLGCLIYGLHLGKTVKSLKAGQDSVK
ncbi:hypothetical protein [Pseudocitrobacter sp. 73]|uniref:hypothetical protein n=1 Tax=Pseudocitrobacter sp. 73 TaxID=2605731 RepID=UPI0011F03F82|nr:hypothetical protein [Pseudocitrobacter sp. 73]KAA1051675.1 hypothetical protein F0Q32_01545 [Pseudocitrobacter sp. 73]